MCEKLNDWLESFIVEFEWKDIAIFKVCLCALGIAVGSALPERKKKSTIVLALLVFALSFAALLARLLGVEDLYDDDYESYDDWEDVEEEEHGTIIRIVTEEE